MSNLPKVSIVVAAYNVSLYLDRCVESILGQTEESIELIIVDDGSTDDTPALADTYAASDSRVKVIHRLNGGLSVARNTGLAAAEGEFVCFMDGDDWVEPNMVKLMMSSCDTFDAPVSIAGVRVDFHGHDDKLIRSESRTLPPYVIRRGVPLDASVCDENLINLVGYAWNKIYRREWLSGLGIQFEEGLNLIEDIDFNARVFSSADRVVLLPESFVHYVQRPRETLGTAREENFLTLRMRSIDAVDSLLESWGVGYTNRSKRSAHACATALWMALLSVAGNPRPREQLRRLLRQPGVDKLISTASTQRSSDWRGRWATSTIRQGWYGMALVPVYLIRSAKVLASRFSA